MTISEEPTSGIERLRKMAESEEPSPSMNVEALEKDDKVSMYEVHIGDENKTLPILDSVIQDIAQGKISLADYLELPEDTEVGFGSVDPNKDPKVTFYNADGSVNTRVRQSALDDDAFTPDKKQLTLEELNADVKERATRATEATAGARVSQAETAKKKQAFNESQAEEIQDLNERRQVLAEDKHAREIQAIDKELQAKVKEIRAKVKEIRANETGEFESSTDFDRTAVGNLLHLGKEVNKNNVRREQAFMRAIERVSKKLTKSMEIKLNAKGIDSDISSAGTDERYNAAIAITPELLRAGLSESKTFTAAIRLADTIEVSEVINAETGKLESDVAKREIKLTDMEKLADKVKAGKLKPGSVYRTKDENDANVFYVYISGDAFVEYNR